MKRIFTICLNWFDEVTPRFQVIVLLGAAVSALLTVILFLQPSLTYVKEMPVKSIGKSEKPNIIYLVSDSLTSEDMSLYGYNLPTTPKLEEISQAWTVYSNAKTALTCTSAALPTLMTGRYTYSDKMRYYGDLINSHPGWMSISNALKQNGYQTWWNGYHSPGFYHMGQGFQKNVCRTDETLFTALNHSWFKVRAMRKSHFPFIPITLDALGYVESGITDFDQCTELDNLESLLQNQTIESPFFIFYHYNGAHFGFPYPSGEALGDFLPISEGLITEEEQRVVYTSYKPEEQPIADKLRLRYDEAIADQDRKLAEFIDSLKRLGIYDSSMIIFTSDHGQNFAHGYTTHCTPLVSNVEASVPLLVKYPYQTEGQWHDFLVSTIDIAPTILDVAGLSYPENWFDGISLLKLKNQNTPKRIVFTRRYGYDFRWVPSEISATDGKYRLVMRGKKLLLFDVQNDPAEMNDLLEQKGYEQMQEVQRLRQALENYQERYQILKSGGDILTALPFDATAITKNKEDD